MRIKRGRCCGFVASAALAGALSPAHAEPLTVPAAPPPQLVLPGRWDEVGVAVDARGRARLVALARGNQLRLVARDGHSPAGLVDAGELNSESVSRGRSAPVATVDREEVLDRFDVPWSEQDAEPPWVEDLLENELGAHRPSARPGGPEPPAPVHVCAGGETVFAVRGGALLTAGPGARWRVLNRRVAPEVQSCAAGAGGQRLALTTARELFVSDDGGSHFAAWPVPGGQARRVLVSAQGRVAVLAEANVFLEGSNGLQPVITDLRAVGGGFCGERLALVGDDSAAFVQADGVVRRANAPGGARYIGCTPKSQWWAAGVGLWVSDDTGQNWQEATAASGFAAVQGAIVAAAADSDGVFAATAAGLMRIAWAQPAAAQVRVTHQIEGAADDENRLPREPRARSPWARLLPRVSVQGAVAETNRGESLTAFAVAEFRVSGRPAPRRYSEAPAARSAHTNGVIAAGWPEPPPCLVELRRAAEEAAWVAPARTRSLLARAGRSAWLPELRVRLERRLGRSESQGAPSAAALAAGVPAPVDLDTANDARYEVRASWDLSRLVFDPDEIAAQAQALRMSDMRRDLLATVNHLFFERRRLAAAGVDGAADGEPGREDADSKTTARAFRLAELDAELSTLTAGASDVCR